MKDLCFIDTETTSLSAESGEIWEFGGIRRNAETGEETRMLLQIDCDLGTADPMSLKIGRYYDRFAQNGWWETNRISLLGDDIFQKEVGPQFPQNGEVCSKIEAAALISEFTRGTHLIGNVISFDAERLERLLRSWCQCPGWHYHLIDLEPMIIGYALACGKTFDLPYSSHDLADWLGVPVPDGDTLHTAMGDAEWVKDMWDALHNLEDRTIVPNPSIDFFKNGPSTV